MIPVTVNATALIVTAGTKAGQAAASGLSNHIETHKLKRKNQESDACACLACKLSN